MDILGIKLYLDDLIILCLLFFLYQEGVKDEIFGEVPVLFYTTLNNIEIVPETIGATVVLDSYSVTVPLSIETTGKLITGKSIASILVNNNSSYSITIYGDQKEIEKITSVPVTINVDGLGNEGTKTYNVNIKKPNGVREMSVNQVEITLTFGEEQQKTIEISKNIDDKNLSEGLAVNILGGQEIYVQVKGVASVIEKIEAKDISAYIDLAGLGTGDYELEVKINNNNPLVTYVVSSKLKVRITDE